MINYTLTDEYILDEVVFTVTYKSDLKLSKMIAIKSAEKILKDFFEKVTKKPFVRLNFQPSGIDVRVRYYTIASERQRVNSDITEEIFKNIMGEKKIDFAYPHTRVSLEKEK